MNNAYNPAYFEARKLFLLRNKSRKGIGFFEVNNFYPDFFLWVIEGEKQKISFIDPKGLRQLNGLENAKIKFHKVIKDEIEPRAERSFFVGRKRNL